MKWRDLNSVQYFWTAVLIVSSVLIAFVPPWLSLLFSSFNKQFLYCPPATKCILFSREQSGVVGPGEYASQCTQWPLRACSHIHRKYLLNYTHTHKLLKKKKEKSSLTNGHPFHSKAKMQASLHVHLAHQVHSAPSRTKYIDSRGNKQADGGQKKQAEWWKNKSNLAHPPSHPASASVIGRWALQLGPANYVYACV